MLEVAEGIQYIHSEGIVHGDICGVRLSLPQARFPNTDIKSLFYYRIMFSWTLIFTLKSPILD